MAAVDIDTSSERLVVLTRIINAPRALVYKAWTDPREMAKWWGPHQFTNPVCNMDVRPGGAYRIVMRAPDGNEYPCKGTYGDIVPPEKLAMLMSHDECPEEWHDMINPKRNKAAGRPAMPTVITVTFAEQGAKTKLTIQISYESGTIRDAFLKLGTTQGWSQSLEKLDNLTMFHPNPGD